MAAKKPVAKPEEPKAEPPVHGKPNRWERPGGKPRE